MRQILAALFLAATTPAFALSVERIVYITPDGTRFYWNTTTDGVVFVAPEEKPDDFYLLTPDCVATNGTFGTGSWGHEEAGWQISFGNALILSFPGQTPPFDAPDCLMLR
jgi:hypothetical protein